MKSQTIKIGFYEELEELRSEYPESDFSFLENIFVASGYDAYSLLHGYCADFAASLSEIYHYPIECIRYPEEDGVEGRLIHAYCTMESEYGKLYIDIRGITNDPELFFGEFENEATYYNGRLYCTNDDGYEVEVKKECWSSKMKLFGGDYEDWENREMKYFIADFSDYYKI